MESASRREPTSEGSAALDPAALLEVVRRVVHSRMGTHPEAEDVVQEAMARVLASAHRIAPGTAEGYAVTTARNLVATT